MYKKLSAKKWKFNLGGWLPPTINGAQSPAIDKLDELMAMYAKQMQAATQQQNNQLPTLPTTPDNIVAEQIAQARQPVVPIQTPNTTTEGTVAAANQVNTGQTAADPTVSTAAGGSTGDSGEGDTEEDTEETSSKFGAQDYIQGAMAGISSLQNAKLNDGKISEDEVAGAGLDVAAGMAGPYGQVANAAITVGENVFGDSLYQGLGEGVEYEKGASRVGKGALKGAAFGAKFGGPIGAIAGSVIGGGINLLGQGRRKRQAMEEFEKRRDERIRNMNQQSKNIYADQYQTFYKKGGKAIIKIKEANKGLFTKHCIRQGYTGVTQECIDKAKKSNSTSLKKQAVFAENVRSFKK